MHFLMSFSIALFMHSSLKRNPFPTAAGAATAAVALLVAMLQCAFSCLFALYFMLQVPLQATPKAGSCCSYRRVLWEQ